MASSLPELPDVSLEVVRDRSDDPSAKAFLDVRRLEIVTTSAGTRSDTFRYDVLARKALDACVMVAHHVEGGVVHVWLVSSLRPPAALRPLEPKHDGRMWEVPAGLVEPGESAVAAAARELAEELGFTVPVSAMQPLGPWAMPAPAFIGEAHHYFHVEVDPASRTKPLGDGSPLEANARVVSVTLDDALTACARGEVRDAKTELALRRFADLVP